MQEERERLMKLIKEFEEKSIDVATYVKDSIASFEAYETARSNILSEPFLHPILPVWMVKNRYGSQFRSAMQGYSANYEGRRMFIRSSIKDLIRCVETGESKPVRISFDDVKSIIKTGGLEDLWRKVHSRREKDPDGAITASRTLLEATLKHILDELCEDYVDNVELPDLYKKVCRRLNLSPATQNEQVFKQILQGISSVVTGFNALRNKYGDAHGKGKNYVGPEKRHADLVVNLAGSMCTFLMETFEAHKKSLRKETL